MGRDEAPFLERGETWYNGRTIDANDLGGESILGREWDFENYDPATGVTRSGTRVRVRACRNLSGGVLYGKQFVKFAAGDPTGIVAATDATDQAFVLDEYLPEGGLADDDIGLVVIKGHSVVQSPHTAVATTVVALGDWVIPIAASRYGKADFNLATVPLADVVNNKAARALSAIAASTSIDTDLPVMVGGW